MSFMLDDQKPKDREVFSTLPSLETSRDYTITHLKAIKIDGLY